MKVVYIHHSGTYGGSSRSLGILLPHLMKLGIDPYIISPEGPASDYFKKITPNVFTQSSHTFPLPMTIVGMPNNTFNFLRNLTMIRNVGRIKGLLKKINPDLIHCNEAGLFPIAKMVRKMGFPVVMHARTMPDKGYPKINNYLLSQVRKYVDHVFCITGSVNHAFASINKKSIVYNPIESFPMEKPKNPNKKEICFLSLSAIQKTKGVFDIIEAARILKDEKHIKFQIAGKLHPHNPADLTLKQKLLVVLGLMNYESTNQLLALIKTHDLKNIELLDHVDNIESAIKKSDVILAPMHLNAPPRSVYEGAAHGLPAILSMEDKVNDVVEHNVSGILIDEEAPEQLASAVAKLANNGHLRTEMGKAARKKCETNHQPETSANKIFEKYKEILSNRM